MRTAIEKTVEVSAEALRLGDRVCLFEGPYGWGTVVQVTEDEVHIFRVYVHVSDVVYTGGLMHYTGHELVKVWREDSRKFTVDEYYHRKMREPGALK